MKDLYTFDTTIEQALQTYETVRQAYRAFFDELKISYLTAEASSGEIGGTLSHEYHFPSVKGEDNLVICSSCDYVVNEELAESRTIRARRLRNHGDEELPVREPASAHLNLVQASNHNLDHELGKGETKWFGVSQDRSTLIEAILPNEVAIPTGTGTSYRKTQMNPYAIKNAFPELDLGVEKPVEAFKDGKAVNETKGRDHRKVRIIQVIDLRCVSQRGSFKSLRTSSHLVQGVDVPIEALITKHDGMIDLVRIESGDSCPNCDNGILRVESAVELGHTFHLGTRYSAPLGATVDANPSLKDSQIGPGTTPGQLSNASERVALQMGCHGIGVSRLIAAVADCLADSRGLNWPRVMAPFEAVVVPIRGLESEAAGVYDLLAGGEHGFPAPPIDLILDDRMRDFGWKLRDADMIGYPVIIIVGRDWKKGQKCEVQCRRLQVRELVEAKNLCAFVDNILRQL